MYYKIYNTMTLNENGKCNNRIRIIFNVHCSYNTLSFWGDLICIPTPCHTLDTNYCV